MIPKRYYEAPVCELPSEELLPGEVENEVENTFDTVYEEDFHTEHLSYPEGVLYDE